MSTRQTANQPGMSSLSQLANLNKKELLLLSEEFEDDDFDEEDDDRLDKTTGTLGDWGMPVQSRVEEVTKPQPQQPQDEERDEIQEVKRIAQGETRVVRIWRVVVAVILITAGALVSYGTYYYLDQQLDDETVNKYKLFVNTIHDVSHMHFLNSVTACQSLARAMTAEATAAAQAAAAAAGVEEMAPSSILPFFTMPQWEVHASEARERGGIEAFVFLPYLVSQRDIDTFTEHAKQHAATWQEQSIAVHQAYNPHFAPLNFGTSSTTEIYELDTKRPTTVNDTALMQQVMKQLPQLQQLKQLQQQMQEQLLEQLQQQQQEGGPLPPPPELPPFELPLPPPILPYWTMSPPPQNNYDMMMANAFPLYAKQIQDAIVTRMFGFGAMDLQLGDTLDDLIGVESHQVVHAMRHPTAARQPGVDPASYTRQTHAYAIQPVFTSLSDTILPMTAPPIPVAGASGGDATTAAGGDAPESMGTQAGTPGPIPMGPLSLEDQIRNGIGGFLVVFGGIDAYLINILPTGVRGIRIVIKNSCGDTVTYELDGNDAIFIGEGDLSDPDYSHLTREINFPLPTTPLGGYCSYHFVVSPSSLFMEDNSSNLPIIFTIVVAGIFAIMVVTFFIYDMQVERRNKKMVNTAARSNAIVSSIFPSTFRDRLMAHKDEQRPQSGDSEGDLLLQPTKTHLKTFLNANVDNDDDEMLLMTSKPIADLFTDTTIMFADIAGFTAWSSVREPSQVFILLETVYRAFDIIAKKRGVFKVETVGDCYVAVCGLPDPRLDHAVVMSRFALDCLTRMQSLSKKLEVMLGPDTGDLGMRIGLHSGPVTAGVLRGERSRFQLFGDTMNTASRMESTGVVNRVQVSEETSKLLVGAGKEHWLMPREEPVEAKGKGILTTFWLKKSGVASSDRYSDDHTTSMSTSTFEGGLVDVSALSNSFGAISSKTSRLIGWNVEVLFTLLRQIVETRRDRGIEPLLCSPEDLKRYESNLARVIAHDNSTVLEEVEEVIWLPHHDRSESMTNTTLGQVRAKQESITTSNSDTLQSASNELVEYVTGIATMYNENPFHNFEHASHVTMSVVKLLSRIVAPSEVDYYENHAASIAKEQPIGQQGTRPSCSTLHDHTYGITSDPLTQFSCVLSALIHDADHPGVPNAQLVNEGQEMALRFKGKSIAEQNSVELAWNMLMEDRFRNLRSVIYVSELELKRFRQLVVNSVMATDIVDKELKALRNARWETAFCKNMPSGGSELENVNRKATIVIEHLIQASDVAHTMQHWHIYRKWNQRFFMECYIAYKEGRAEQNPADFWYQGEIGFFDFYIIPLAKKLKDCGVFGVSSDEYLNYATSNRNEWKVRGSELVAEMMEQIQAKSMSSRRLTRDVRLSPKTVWRTTPISASHPSKASSDVPDRGSKDKSVKNPSLNSKGPRVHGKGPKSPQKDVGKTVVSGPSSSTTVQIDI